MFTRSFFLIAEEDDSWDRRPPEELVIMSHSSS